MKLTKYNDYINELQKEYPKIEIDQLKRIVKTFLHLMVQELANNEDIAMKTKDFFLGIVSVRSKKDSDMFSYMKNKQLKNYRNNRKLNKKHENEQKISSNKHI